MWENGGKTSKSGRSKDDLKDGRRGQKKDATGSSFQGTAKAGWCLKDGPREIKELDPKYGRPRGLLTH